MASKAKYRLLTDSVKVVQTTDEKDSEKRVKQQVKPFAVHRMDGSNSMPVVHLPVLKHGPRSLLQRVRVTDAEAGHWGESILCEMTKSWFGSITLISRSTGKKEIREPVRRDPKDGDLFLTRLKCCGNSGGGSSRY